MYFVNTTTVSSSKSVEIWLSKWIFYVKTNSKLPHIFKKKNKANSLVMSLGAHFLIIIFDKTTISLEYSSISN